MPLKEFEKLIADQPALKGLYEKLVTGVIETSGEDERVVKALIANLILSSITKPREREGEEEAEKEK